MAKIITYQCDGEKCTNKHVIINDQDRCPDGWYWSVSNMGRNIKLLCPDCYQRMCILDNGFLGGD